MGGVGLLNLAGLDAVKLFYFPPPFIYIILFEPIVRLFVLHIHLLSVVQGCLSWRGDRFQLRSFLRR